MERSSAGLCGLLKDGERLCRLIVTLRPSVPPPTFLPFFSIGRDFVTSSTPAPLSASLPTISLASRFTVDELYYDHNLPKLLADQVLRQQLVQWGIKQRIPFLGPAHRLRASKILAKWPQTRKASMSGGSSLGLPLFSSFAGSVSEERTAAAIKIQSVFRSWHAQRVYNAKLRNARHREKIARELYDTEKEYAQNLQILIQVYLKKMHTWAENAPMSGMKALYGDIKVIHGYTEQVLAQLRPRVYAWGPHQVLGDIFLQLGFFLKVYTQYVTNYSKATRELAERKKKSTRFAQFLDAPWSVDPAALLFRDKIGSLGIQSFLIQPVQRVPRYLLLLNALLKRTDPDHKDYNNIQKAAQQVSQVADYIEKRARESENIAKVIEIQNRLHPKLQPNRKFVRSCRMSVEICQAWGVPTPATQGGGAGRVPPYAYPSTTTAASDGKKSPRRRQQGLPKNYEVFLCSDLLLVAKPKDPHNPDTPLKLRAAYDITQLHPSADMSDHLRFALVSEKGQTVARFTAASATDRHSWLTDLAKLKITREMSRKHRA
ncbi:RhoGEF domain containing protein, partial [Acanthamoeba castellanii str. Neff]